MLTLRKLLLLFPLIFLLGLAKPTQAENGFIVRNIQFQGLQRVRQSTVLSYIHVHIGQRITSAQMQDIITTLFKTGFFSEVNLYRSGTTLVVRVKERPVIASINITGNDEIKTKKLKPVLKQLGIVEGEVFDPSKLHQITTGLQQQYDLLGRYAAVVDAQMIQEPRNRVSINIHITEGPIAKVRRITIIGNNDFTTHQLLKQFKLTTPGITTIFTKNDRYSKYKLEQDLYNLRNFYYNHGYLKFRVISKQVDISDDHKSVYITVTVSEGPVYRVSEFTLIGPAAKDPNIERFITVHPDEIFSRDKIVYINHQITTYFTNHGYAFPTIKAIPTLNDINHTVAVKLLVDPGRRVYVRHIVISGNLRTEDSALRNQVRQYEGSVYAQDKIEESKRRLANLPYLQNVTAQTVPVPGNPSLVDVYFHAEEVTAGKASLQGGWSQTEGFLYGASVSEPNFLGTGKYVALAFQRSQVTTSVSFSYNNPFYTVSGISRGFSLYYTRTNPNLGAVNIDNSYITDNYGGQVFYGIPMSDYDDLTAGFGYDHILIKNINNATIAASPLEFLIQHGYNVAAGGNVPLAQLKGTIGWAHATLDRAYFPTRGSVDTLNITIGPGIFSQSANYYLVTFQGRWYFPLGYGFIIHPHSILGFGDSFTAGRALPFIYNFYGGGIGTLPGFQANSLGPRNPNNGGALGGNLELFSGIDFIFPNPYPTKLRTSVIVNAGNIFQTHRPSPLTPANGFENIESFGLRYIRVAVGVKAIWLSPMGPLSLTLAFPVHRVAGDRQEIFGFSFGAAI